MADNTKPFFGGLSKCQAQLDADTKFVESFDERVEDRAYTAGSIVNGGLSHVDVGNFDEGMMRFNQAWLLKPEFFGVYLGYGVVLALRDQDFDEARIHFADAHRLVPADQREKLSLIEGQTLCMATTSHVEREAIATRLLDQVPRSRSLDTVLEVCSSGASGELPKL